MKRKSPPDGVDSLLQLRILASPLKKFLYHGQIADIARLKPLRVVNNK